MTSNSKRREFLLKGVVWFVIVVAGVITGVFIAGKSGLAGQSHDHKEATLPQSAALRAGELFPDISVLDNKGLTIRLLDLVEERTHEQTLIVFASSGCLPCHDFLDALSTSTKVQQGEPKVILLVDHLDKFSDYGQFTLLEVMPRQEAELEVSIFPTFLIVERTGIVKQVWITYNPNNPPGFM